VAAGDTHAYDPGTPCEEALRRWIDEPEATFVLEDGGRVLGQALCEPSPSSGGLLRFARYRYLASVHRRPLP